MNFSDRLTQAWNLNRSLLCVGLDPDLNKIPKEYSKHKDGLFQFNKMVIESTADQVCAYKPQAAYYSAVGAEKDLVATIKFIKEKHPEILVILDAKRSDIESTAEKYAEEAFDRYQADAVTVNPYMGTDSIFPFTRRKDKGTIILCRTTNVGSKDFQDLDCGQRKLYQIVAEKAATDWNSNNNVMLVVGATYPEELGIVRKLVPQIPFLIPGIGRQSGDLRATIEAGKDANNSGMIINSSRGIIYADSESDAPTSIRSAAKILKDQINQVLKR